MGLKPNNGDITDNAAADDVTTPGKRKAVVQISLNDQIISPLL